MFSLKHYSSKFEKINKPMSKKEEALYSNILPSTNNLAQDIKQDFRRIETRPMCIVQSKFHTCTNSIQAFQPFTNFFQLRQNQEILNRDWNDFNIDKKMKNMEKQRARDDMAMPFNPTPYFNMVPVCTSGTRPNLTDPTRVNF